jgi:CheY-specific phosphatase CheX
MPDGLIEQALSRAAGDVLEKMFFAGFEAGPPTDPNGDPSIAVRMAFDGERRGVLALRISTIAARTLAADFLGVEAADGPDETRVRDVVRELANMICGDVLSALERSPLRLSAPEIMPAADFVLPAGGSHRSFDLGNGVLTVALTFLEDARV